MSTARRSLLLHALTGTGGLVAALLVASVFRTGTFSLLRPSPPEGYVAERTVGGTVYAPSHEAAREGGREVEHARERFRAHFGARPARLVVVLADEPSKLREIDLDRLRWPRAEFLPFVTTAHLKARQAAAEMGGESYRAKPLAHEACHRFVSAFANRSAPPSSRTGTAYGHAALPDWFDESVATLCESADGRENRRRHFRANLHRRIALREFERMPHPLGEEEVLRRLGIDRSSGETGVYFIPAEEMKRLLPGLDAPLFYAQALSLGEFLSQRGGPGAMGRLANAFARGSSLEEALTQVRQGAPGLPGSLEELEAEWIGWVRAQGGS